MSVKRRFPLPVYVFDEHHEAFAFWHQAYCDGLLKHPLDLFHVDAHDDMGQIRKFSLSLYYQGKDPEKCRLHFDRISREELNIGNFIYPAVLTGVVKNVYFVYPSWRNYRFHRKFLSICSAFGEGKVFKFGLPVKEQDDSRIHKAFPDFKRFCHTTCRIEKVPRSRKVILDIDMDYFYCVDSITNHLRYNLEITPKQYQLREDWLQEKTLPFSGLKFEFCKRGSRHYVRIGYRKTQETAYQPEREEIDDQINLLMKNLSGRDIHPQIVTLCRSHLSGFCPSDKAAFIESRLLEKLESYYSPIDVHYSKKRSK